MSIGIVGKDLQFIIYDDDDVAPFLEGLEERPQRKVGCSFIQHVKVSGQLRFCDDGSGSPCPIGADPRTKPLGI